MVSGIMGTSILIQAAFPVPAPVPGEPDRDHECSHYDHQGWSFVIQGDRCCSQLWPILSNDYFWMYWFYGQVYWT